MMALFTVILDYRGGTYISQVEATEPHAALLQWAAALDPRPIAFFGKKRKQSMVKELLHDEYGLYFPVALEGLLNAWCVSLPLPGSLVNIVETASNA
jgi:hypothetical protein